MVVGAVAFVLLRCGFSTLVAFDQSTTGAINLTHLINAVMTSLRHRRRSGMLFKSSINRL